MRKPIPIVEITVLFLYAVALLVMMHFHEPWFDEAQAWLIARDASPFELLTSITHYEGHPPLWFAVLMPLAKLGVPFEIGLKAVNFAFAVAAMGLLIFKAPFPRIIRCSIPFTYFFFYQYGVISRPYSMMMLGFVLCAIFFGDRNRRPWRFIGSMALVCGSSLYGVVLSAGIAVVWLMEILADIRLREAVLTKDHRLTGLLLLLIFNAIIVVSACPPEDAYAVKLLVQDRSQFLWGLYLLLLAPADTIITSLFADITHHGWYEYLAGVVISCVMIIATYAAASLSNKRSLFLVPYMGLILFGGAAYFSDHHLGIFSMFYLFVWWCCYAELQKSQTVLFDNNKYLKYFGITLLIVALASTLRWSVIAARNDIFLNYGTGREAAAFIKANRLDQQNILASWRIIPDEQQVGLGYQDFDATEGIPAMAYFDKNIFINVNDGDVKRSYVSHRIDYIGAYTRQITDNDAEVLFTNMLPDYTFGEQINQDNYRLVKAVRGNKIWKDEIVDYWVLIYLRRDLALP